MMCYQEEQLIAYLDGELSPQEVAALKAHLASCPACARQLSLLEEELGFVEVKLAAYRKGAMALEPRGYMDHVPQQERKEKKMGKWKKLSITAAAVAAAFLLVIFTPLGAVAADLLNVFRVEKFVAVKITQQEMEAISQAMADGQGSIDLEDIGTVDVSGSPQSEQVAIEEAKQQANWPFLQLPPQTAGYALAGASRTQATGLTFKLDVAKANAMIGRFGGEKLFPESLDQQAFTFSLPAMVSLDYQGEGGKKLMLTQGLSPQVSLPAGTDIEAIRDVVINLPFIPQSLRSRLAAIGDWRNAAIIPTMENEGEEVTVRGQQGILLSLPSVQVRGDDLQASADGSFTVSGGDSGQNCLLMWQENGVIYSLHGNVSRQEILNLAAELE